MTRPQFLSSLAGFILALSLGACELGQPPECDCVPDEAPGEGWGSEPSSPTCGTQLCGSIRASDQNANETWELTDPGTLDCALEALRDHTPGVIRWSETTESGQFDTQGYVLIREDGTATVRSWGAEDLSWVVEDAQGGQLPSSDYFELCLGYSSARSRFDCLSGIELGQAVTCDEGWLDESI